MAATLNSDRNFLIVSRRDEKYAEMNSDGYLSCPKKTGKTLHQTSGDGVSGRTRLVMLNGLSCKH